MLYVFSGSLKAIRVDAEDPYEAVDAAVRANLPCVLGPAIRVSIKEKKLHPQDVFFEPPYEDLFPDLFNGDLDVQVARAEQLR